MGIYYTCEENTLILISLLKKYNIKKIIASPGTTNCSFVASVQNDHFFEVFSAVDERAASFMACGLAEASSEPVVLTCTGATASRNYVPGLTEAYYKKLPVLAVTSTQHLGRVGNYVPQVIDRTKQFADMCKLSLQLSTIFSSEDRENAVTRVNEVLLELSSKTPGPCHINLVTNYSNDFSVKVLPEYRKINRYYLSDELPIIGDRKVGVYIGSHSDFSDELKIAIEKFCEVNNAIVLSDHICNYRGKYKIHANILNNQNFSYHTKEFDLIIDIGYVSGYLPFYSKEIWRVNEDGKIRNRFNRITAVFEMSELDFFNQYNNGQTKNTSLYEKCVIEKKDLDSQIPNLPFSNLWISQQTSKVLPNDSVIHLAILNTLRAWGYFEIDDSILAYSNTGGFGIDGCMSSMIGAALASPNKKIYGFIGDLAFFYDQNSLMNIIPSNLHIMVINNGCGTEFKNYNHRCSYFGEDAIPFMAAKGHNGFKSKRLVANYSKNLGIDYYSASNKDEYFDVIDKWINSEKACILEVFTNDYDESNALKMINSIKSDFKHRVWAKIRNTKLGGLVKKILR